MKINLTLKETRVIGSLIEKEITTPDQYPLSLNALTNACNQKSNREPVMELDQDVVQEVTDDLIGKLLVVEDSYSGSRVVKYKHRFCNTPFGSLTFTEQELGIICVLLLRGPQTPGELRSRTNRLCRFSNVTEVEATLKALMDAENGPFVVKLPREPGRRESRYAHLFSGEVISAVKEPHPAAAPEIRPLNPDRLAQLEERVAALEAELDSLKRTVEDNVL